MCAANRVLINKPTRVANRPEGKGQSDVTGRSAGWFRMKDCGVVASRAGTVSFVVIVSATCTLREQLQSHRWS
jgi:hypothetical protein